MKRKLASLFFIVTSKGTPYAEGVSSTPSILYFNDEKSIEFLLTDERSATRGEVFHISWGKTATSKAEEWCQGRGRCFCEEDALFARAYDPKCDGSIIINHIK
jgi:hypothetical protein